MHPCSACLALLTGGRQTHNSAGAEGRRALSPMGLLARFRTSRHPEPSAVARCSAPCCATALPSRDTHRMDELALSSLASTCAASSPNVAAVMSPCRAAGVASLKDTSRNSMPVSPRSASQRATSCTWPMRLWKRFLLFPFRRKTPALHGAGPRVVLCSVRS